MWKIVGDEEVLRNMAAKLLAEQGGLWYSTKNTTSEGEVPRTFGADPIGSDMKIH
jgi:hypothetical protein